MKKSRFNLIYFLIIVLFLLSACGQKAVITLPPDDPTAIPAIEPQPTDPPEEVSEPVEPGIEDLLKAGTAMKWYDDGYIVFVPQGEVTLGDNEYKNNMVHEVFVDDYWIYMFNVTNGQYRQCVATGACTPPASEEPYPDLNDVNIKDKPVIGVNWEQANTYCEWMNGRLPTKAEWEKAARGPESNTYPWGEDDPTCDLLNYGECEDPAITKVYEYLDGRSYYQAFDLAGNTFEWAYDLYEYDIIAQLPDEPPAGPPDGTERSVRGSDYKSTEELIPSALLYYLEPESYRTDLGFRCVLQGAEPKAFASPCIQTAFVDGLPAPWQPGPPTGENELPDLDERTCVPEFELTHTMYCADQSIQRGGLDIYLTGLPGSDAYINTWTPNGGGVACVDSTDHLGCFGPEGTAITFEICASCTPLPNMATTYLVCDSGFTLTHTDPPTCVYNGQPVPGGTCPANFAYDPIEDICFKVGQDSDECPVGYEYNPDTDCCIATFAEPSPDSQGSSSSYLTCPPGYGNVQFDSAVSVEGDWYATCHYLVFPTSDIETCETVTYNLGDCPDPRCTNPKSYTNKSSCEDAYCKWYTDPASGAAYCISPP